MKNRLPSGGLIDRHRPLSFTFNKRQLQGFSGDTIASALLANGIRVVSRSYKYHRPRGVYSAGAEEPNAIFTVRHNGRLTPNVRATLTPLQDGMDIRSQGGWPSLSFDVGAIFSTFSGLLPAGFYYKTFMHPARLWMSYEKIIRRMASSAPVPADKDPDSYRHYHAHCDILVVGGGAAGLAAALTAARRGAKLIIADMAMTLGGQLQDEGDKTIDGQSAQRWLTETVEKLRSMENVTVLPATTIQGYYDYNYLIGVQTPPDSPGAPRRRLWRIRAGKVILATGAIERPLVFAGNDAPGVMLASAVPAYIHRFGVLPGHNILFFTNNDSAYAAAFAAADAGARVEIADLRQNENGHWQSRAADRKIEVYYGAGITSVLHQGDLLSVNIGQVEEEWMQPLVAHAYHTVAVSGGWTPTVHLFSQARGSLQWDARLGAFKPAQAHAINPCQVAGAANGATDLAQCLREGAAAGNQAATECGCKDSGGGDDVPVAESAPLEQVPLFSPIIPTSHPVGQGPGKHFVDLMNDVTAADIYLSAQEGYQSVEHMKRYTAAGFGTEQGKTGNINALTLLAKALGKAPAEVGHTTYRPPYTPMPFGLITGGDRDAVFTQARATPIDPWHRAHHAVYEDVGDWKRPRYFPHPGESMDDAVWRECKAARNDVAAMDASTLGKIDIQGADAGKFLDMIYTNQFSTLPVGKCRYGLMLHDTGMIFDDGVTARLGENHFHMTTSTGHAAAVMNWLEEWLQTEWPDMQVFCTSVTEQWAVIALAGPKARALLAEMTDIPLAAAEFPFMSWQAGEVCGVPARVFRISFSGESAFEINVPARYGLSVWEHIFTLGEKHGITAYGTESMHVLRAEKGYIIVGQDSDGTMTPMDMGLSWMLSKKKEDFIGKRSLSRPDMTRPDRPQLVGLLPEDAKAVIPEGAHLLTDPGGKPPMTAVGFVTSSYMSPTLERSFAMAMLNNGRARAGETVYAAFMNGDRIKATVTKPLFWDEEGKRLNG